MLFRRGPDSLPDSQFLLVLAAGLYILLDVVALLSGAPAAPVVPMVAVDFLFLTAYCASLLYFFGFEARLRQTMTALFGTGVLLDLLIIGLLTNPFAGFLPVMSQLAVVICLLWNVAIFGHIVSQAISRSFMRFVDLASRYTI